MRAHSILIPVGVVATLAWGVQAQVQEAPKPRQGANPPGTESAVAAVGPLRIGRAAFERRVQEVEASYRARSASPLPTEYRPMMRRQVLESLIREHLLTLEAARRGLSPSAAEAEEELKKDPFFQSQGFFDEAKFLAVKMSQPQRFQSAIAEIQNIRPAIRLKEELERQARPDDVALRAEVARSLTKTTLEYLALRRADFADGFEPREADVLRYYQEHPNEFQRAEEVSLSVVLVDQPPLDPSLASPDQARAWEARMQQSADSLIAAARGGARLEDLAFPFGGVRRGILVERAGRFPDYWRGGPRTRQAVFALEPGQILAEAVPGERGWLVARVDQHTAPRVAPLRSVAARIRATLRADSARRLEERDLRALYPTLRDSLRGVAYRVRYAVADTGAIAVPEPTPAELDRYYRGHLADYSAFDAATVSVVARPFAEVREDVRARLLKERRVAAARTASEQLFVVWQRGKRDSRLERALGAVREVGPILAGGLADTGRAGQALSDTLATRPGLGTGMVRFARGWIVYRVLDEVPDFTPTFEQIRPLLAARRGPMAEARVEQGARELFEKEPERFRSRPRILFSRLMISPPDLLNVPVTREEVEARYRSHTQDYGAPELARVRHILINLPDASPQGDAEARRKAESLLQRVRAGESFAALASQYSDDQATKHNGGDVGMFRHGMMLDEFERAAFGMRPGDLRGPVRTEVGYHIIESLEHVPAEVTPLKYCYANVAADVARENAGKIARFRADSLLKSLKSVAEARRIAIQTGHLLFQNEHEIGTPPGVPELRDYFVRLEGVRPGQLYPGVQEYKGMGFAVTWVDSVLPPRRTTWEDMRSGALGVYRMEEDLRRMRAKRTELDSMQRAGWSFDSLAALRGGLQIHGPDGPGKGLSGLGGSQIVDSLAFGGLESPPMELGSVTGWIEFPGGLVRLRVAERRDPDPVELAGQLDNRRRMDIEKNLQAIYEKLKQRFPVRIHDQELRMIVMPDLSGS